MALNIFPRKPAQTSETKEAEPTPPPPIDAADEDNNASSSSRRRTSTRSRRTTARSRSAKAAEENDASTPSEEAPAADAPAADQKEAPARAAASESDGDDPPRATRRGTRSRTRKTAAEREQEKAEKAAKAESETDTTAAPADEPSDAPAKADDEKAPARRSTRSSRSTARTTDPAGADLSPLLKAIEQQGKQIEALTRAIQDGQGQGNGTSPANVAPARVGVFVDVANVELGADRARMRVDWGKVLRLLTRDRQLVRAIAYAPVHDDPQVSRETQRFVEPFLDKGYKIVTKPLKRFSDGTVKANVDIELALDVVSMIDRLDVICLVSGDGDFEPLVRVAQDRGVRVEVVALSNSCANQLREASDAFLDLQARANDIRA